LPFFVASWSQPVATPQFPEKVVMQKRIGPESPGLSRFLAARMMMLVMCAFYAAGLVLAFLYGFGINAMK
jgi:nucleoside recognition membrane protein YjiH